MTEENTFRKTTPVPTHDSAAGQSVSASTESTVDFAMLEPRDQLKTLLQAEMKDKPFSELSSVLFDHRGASIVGHILLDTLEEAGYSVDDFDAVGALTAAAVPLVSAMNPPPPPVVRIWTVSSWTSSIRPSRVRRLPANAWC